MKPGVSHPAVAAGLRRFRRGLRDELQILLMVALCIAVASSATVALFSDRVTRALERQSGEAIGADRVIRSRQPIPDEWLSLAREAGLQIAKTTQLASTARGPKGFSLVGVKAVTDNYPLRGRVQVESLARAAGEGAISNFSAAPLGSNDVWVDHRILADLGVTIGAEIELGLTNVRIAGVIHYEPDRGSGFLSLAPRLMMRFDDLAATGLVAPGSRTRYYLLVAGEEAELQRFERSVAELLPDDARLMAPRDARRELQQALDRAGDFLALVSMASILISGVGIALCAHQLASRREDEVALMKTLGSTRRFLLHATLAELAAIGALSIGLGLLLGVAGQAGLAFLLRDNIDIALPSASLLGLLPGAATGVLMLLGFALPPVLHAREAPPARIFQDSYQTPAAPWLLWYLGYALAIALVLILHTGDVTATAIILGGSAVCVVGLSILAWLMVLGLGRLKSRVGVAWRYGLANVSRRRSQSVIQAVAFGTGLMAILMLTVVRSELLTTWRDSVPTDAPNHFLINVSSDQTDAASALLAEHGVRAVMYPMVQGRLAEINGTPVSAADYAGDEDAQRFIRREMRLSFESELRDDNRVIDGAFFGADAVGQPVLSIEDFIQKRLNVGVGDNLTFDIAGQRLELEITSVRVVNWDSMRANFFLLTPPGVLDAFDATWISAIYIGPDQRDALRALIDAFPNISAINIEMLLEQARAITDRMATAIEYLLLFAVLAGVVVLLAGVQSTRGERQREAALLRTLGAKRSVVAQGLLAEFVALGLVAGLLAAAAAQWVAWLFASRVLDAPFEFSLATWAIGALAGVVGVSLAGLAGTWRILDTPPAQALR